MRNGESPGEKANTIARYKILKVYGAFRWPYFIMEGPNIRSEWMEGDALDTTGPG